MEVNDNEESRPGSSASSQMTIEESFDLFNSFRDSGNRSQNYTNAITTWVAKDVVAANIVADGGFGKMFHIISPRYKVPHPDTIQRRIDGRFHEAKEYIIDRLSKFPHIALTADS